VHEELLRKATAKEVDKEMDAERSRRVEESRDEHSEINVQRRETYNRLVAVQEDLLKTIQGMKADEEMKQEQQRRVAEDKKLDMQEQLVHEMGKRKAAEAMDKERERRVDETEHISEEEAERRLVIARKMLDVQKELLATHAPTKPIAGVHSQDVLEEAKFYMQEQLLRKAAQKEALAAMDQEQKRRVTEAPKSPPGGVTDSQVEVLEQIRRKANVKLAKEMADTQQQEYILAEQKARAQEETMRKVHQKEADKAMDQEKEERVSDMQGKVPPRIDTTLQKELKEHPLSPK